MINVNINFQLPKTFDYEGLEDLLRGYFQTSDYDNLKIKTIKNVVDLTMKLDKYKTMLYKLDDDFKQMLTNFRQGFKSQIKDVIINKKVWSKDCVMSDLKITMYYVS